MLTNDSLTIIRIFLINNFEKLPNRLTIKLGNQACSSMRKISFRQVLGKWAISELPSTFVKKCHRAKPFA